MKAKIITPAEKRRKEISEEIRRRMVATKEAIDRGKKTFPLP